jgi:FkbM family methyltransferase
MKISRFFHKNYFEKRRLYKTARFQEGYSNFLEFPFYFADAATFLHGYEEIFDQEIYKFNATSNAPNIIDCGSNIGLSVVYFKRLYPNARVTAFEPDKNIAQTLKKNIESFKLSNIEVNEKAIWINNNGIEFQQEGGFSGRIPKPGDTENIVKVPTKRLKDLLISKVDFLKMDIEGAEYPVILDCADSLENVENFFIEYHSHVKEEQDLHMILELLHSKGFRYHIHEAYTRKHPFVSNESMVGMDLQLNIFAKKIK